MRKPLEIFGLRVPVNAYEARTQHVMQDICTSARRRHVMVGFVFLSILCTLR